MFARFINAFFLGGPRLIEQPRYQAHCGYYDVVVNNTGPAGMTPIGYMYKTVMARPDWLKAPGVVDIRSLSGCMSTDFADYIIYLIHKGYWLFDAPRII